MNKLKQMLSAIFTLVLVNVGTAQADSSNFGLKPDEHVLFFGHHSSETDSKSLFSRSYFSQPCP